MVPGLPHHVTQWGNRREAIFFEDGDQEIYRDLLAEQMRKADVEVWPWSSVRAHLAGADDERVSVRPVLERAPQFAQLLAGRGEEGFAALRRADGSGRPVGTADFIADLEQILGRPIARSAPGRKPRLAANPQPRLLL